MQKKTLVSACLVISGVFLVFILIILFFRPSGSDVGGTDTTAVHITSANGEELPAFQYDGQVAWIDVPGTAISSARRKVKTLSSTATVWKMMRMQNGFHSSNAFHRKASPRNIKKFV